MATGLYLHLLLIQFREVVDKHHFVHICISGGTQLVWLRQCPGCDQVSEGTWSWRSPAVVPPQNKTPSDNQEVASPAGGGQDAECPRYKPTVQRQDTSPQCSVWWPLCTCLVASASTCACDSGYQALPCPRLLVGAFSAITNLRMDLFEALYSVYAVDVSL